MRTLDWEKINAVADALKEAPRTIEEIAELGGVNERTAYRWIDLMIESGSDVIRRKTNPVTFQILEPAA